MAVTAYAGSPGSGKTYEVVTGVIVEAIKTGRRVVGNIRGVDVELIRAHLIEKGSEASALGSMVVVPLKAPVDDPHFFYSPDDAASVVQPGDVVVLDECWTVLSTDAVITERMMTFFRMHRQYVDAKGVSCDVVLITQDMSDLHRKVKVVVEKYFRMEKLKRIGQSNRYTVDVFNGWKSARKPMQRLIRKYDKAMFAFYSSYSGKGGDEREVDKRINVLRNPLFIAAMCVAPFLAIGGLYAVYKLWVVKPRELQAAAEARDAKGKKDAKSVDKKKGADEVRPGGRVSVASAGEGGPVASWRVVGVYTTGDRVTMLLEGSGGRVRHVYAPDSFNVGRWDWSAYVDGELVTSWGPGPGAGRGGIVQPGAGGK